MTIQMLADAWKVAGADRSWNPPATEAEIQAAEEKIGVTLPAPLREVYLLFNGGWALNLLIRIEMNFFPLAPTPDEDLAVINANEKYIEWEWCIPQEIRLFAHNGGEEAYGIWLPKIGNPIYNHPIIEVGELSGEGCMGVVGTNLLSFLRGWSALQFVMEESDELWKVELVEDKDAPNRLKRVQTFLDTLEVPQSLRAEHHDEDPDENFAQLRKWADPKLPDPYGTSYSQEYTVTDLKRLFGESR